MSFPTFQRTQVQYAILEAIKHFHPIVSRFK